MKNYFYAALAALLTAGCASEAGYTLLGEVPEAWEGKPVVLYTTDAGAVTAVDSTTVKNGKFSIAGAFDMPRNCRVAVFLDPEDRLNRDLIATFPVFLDSTAVNVVCDASQTKPVFTLSGGATQTEWQAYKAALEPLSADRSRAFDAYVQAFYREGDVARGVELAREVDAKMALVNEFKIAYMRENPASAVSLAILQEFCDRHSELNKEQLSALFDALVPQLKVSAVGRHTAGLIADKRVVLGEPYPDLELRDREGNVRRISEFVRPGRITLLEIWASWCAPCRGDIPAVKKTYEKYHKRGFDVLYISIDTKTDNWVEALDAEKMPWPQLVDTSRQSFSAYETSAVPTSLLIDGEGRFCRLNARGGWLDLALEQAYGN